MARNKQTYQYHKDKSILAHQSDDYEISVDEYYLLYSFFVTYSCCGNQSGKKRTFSEILMVVSRETIQELVQM